MIARAIGGIAVDRGSGSNQPLRDAEAALKAGEVVDRAPAGDHPAWLRLLRPRAAGQDGNGPSGGVDRGHRGARSDCGAPRRYGPARPGCPTSRLVRNPPTVTGAHRQARGPLAHGRQGGHRDDHGGHHRAAAGRGAGAPRADADGVGSHQAASVRARLASATTRAVNAASRRLGRGQGTVAGGRAGLRVDPRLLEHLSAGRQVALVTGTNGKTTTTRLLTVGARGRRGTPS